MEVANERDNTSPKILYTILIKLYYNYIFIRYHLGLNHLHI